MSVVDMNTPFVVDADTREIINKEHKKKVLIQGDHNSERFTFEIPRFIEGKDVGKCNSVQIHYINVGKGGQSTGVYTVTDLNVYEFIHDILNCSWLISHNATKYEGTLSFMIRFAEIVNETEIKYAWHTEAYEGIKVAKNIDAAEDFEEEYVDVIAQWKRDVLAEMHNYVDAAVESSVDIATKELVARLDNLAKTPAGSTSGDLELMDIRVGSNGKVYDNAGEAVRGQYNEIMDFLSDQNGALESVLSASFYNCCIVNKVGYDGTNEDDLSEGTTKPNAVFAIFEIIPEGLSKVSVETEKPLTLYFFDSDVGPDDQVLNLFNKKTCTPVNGVVNVYVDSKVPYILGLQGEVGYKISTNPGPYRKRLADLTKKDDGSYSYKFSSYICFNLSITTYDSVKKHDTDKCDVRVPTARIRMNPHKGNVIMLDNKIVVSPIYSANKYDTINIVTSDPNDRLLLYLMYYGNDGAFIESEICQADAKPFVHKLKTGCFKLVISAPDMADGDFYDTNRLAEIFLSKEVKVEDDRTNIAYVATSKEKVHIKLLGDSITQGSGSTGYVEWSADGYTIRGNGPDCPSAGPNYVQGDYLGTRDNIKWYESTSGSGWGQLMKSYFESKFNCVVKNYGMGGATVNDLLNNLSRIVSEEDDIILLMIGTNDRKSLSKTDYTIKLVSLIKGLVKMDKKVILMSPVPMVVSTDAGSTYFHMEDANNICSAIAYEHKLPFISLFNKIQEYAEFKDIDIASLFNSDGVHPNDTGYNVIFKTITRNIGLGVKCDGATW